MLNPEVYFNSMPDGVAVLEIIGVPDPEKAGRRFVPLRRTELRGTMAGPLASLRVTHLFGYSKDQCDQILEAAYRFPLPGDAAVTGARVRFGEVEIVAALKAREEAESEYDTARSEGRQAALLTREAPNVFTLQVTGIQPDQEIAVETDYVQLARAEGSGWSLRIPLTTAPRYTRSDEAGSRHAEGQPLALLRDPGHRFGLDVAFKEAGLVASPSHALEVTQEDGGRRVRLRDGEVIPDRDCVLTWEPAREAERPAFRLVLHDDPGGSAAYFLALIAPPSGRPHEERIEDGTKAGLLSRESILLVDHSGSMEGPKWEAADWAIERFLRDLTDRDRFNLGLFHSTTRWFARGPMAAAKGAVDRAVRFLKGHKDSGGTELGVALEQALRQDVGGGEVARHLLIVTDAEVTDAPRILRLASEEAMRPARRRISVLCIDAAPNAFLAQELADAGGGVARFLTSDPEEADITTALDEILADWSAPLNVGLRLEVNRPKVEGAGREAVEASKPGWSALDLGDLPSGRAVWAVGRIPTGGGEDLVFRVKDAGGAVLASWRPGKAREAVRLPALKALFGARRILGLESLIHSAYSAEQVEDGLRRLGYAPDDARVPEASPPTDVPVYADNARLDAESALKGLLAREALDYGLASSETAFVAARSEAGRPIGASAAVGNALPAGWSSRFLTFARASACRSPSGGMMEFRLLSAAPPSPAGNPNVLFSAMVEPADFGATDPADADPTDVMLVAEAADLAPDEEVALSDADEAIDDKQETEDEWAPLFVGVPSFRNGEAVLFDSAERPPDGGMPDRGLPEEGTFTRLSIKITDGGPGDAVLVFFVGDLSSPRARVRLADLLRQGGERPLNIRRRPGQRVRIVLQDPHGAWTGDSPLIEVALRCEA